MKKLGWSLVTIVLTISLASGTIYALFNDTVHVRGITITTGTVDLKLNDSDNPFNFGGGPISNLLPGESRPAIVPFKLTNASSAQIGMNIKAKLINPTTGASWDALKDFVLIQIRNADDAGQTSGYLKLSEWGTDYKNVNSLIGFSSFASYVMDVQVDPALDNSAAGIQIENINFDIIGEQNI